MRNFDKKVKELSSLFICKFKFYDAKNQKLKIYYISPDNSHIYFSVDLTPKEDKLYGCEIGELYFDKIKNTAFEDTPNETFNITKSNHKTFHDHYNTIPEWDNRKIKEIVKFSDQIKMDLFL